MALPAVARACAAARGNLTGDAGPVHVNVPLREPLVAMPDAAGEPVLAGRPAGQAGRDRLGAGAPAVSGSGADITATPGPSSSSVTCPRPGWRRRWWSSPAPAAGRWSPSPSAAIDRTAVVPHGPLLLGAGSWLEAHLPEQVLVVGRITLARTVAAVCGTRRTGRGGRGHRRLGGPVARRVPRPAVGLHPGEAGPAVDGRGDHAWAGEWTEAGTAGSPSPPPRSSPPYVAVGPAVAVGAGGGRRRRRRCSSARLNPVRDLDLAVGPGVLDAAHMQRGGEPGLAGIDGSGASTAAGVALAAPDRPDVRADGDLTFLHDQGGC